MQALQALRLDDVKAILLDRNVRNLHFRFGVPLTRGDFLDEDERNYIADAVAHMDPDDQRLLLQYAAQKHGSVSV